VSPPVRFLAYNLLPSVAGGFLAWLIAAAAIRILGLRSSAQGFCFASLAIFKSLALLLGVGLILPWPNGWFERLHALGLRLGQVLPFLLIWAGAVYVVFAAAVLRSKRVLGKSARPAAEAEPRLPPIFDSVVARFRAFTLRCSDDLCSVRTPWQAPRLMVSARVGSPMAAAGGGKAFILFPSGLAAHLTDEELGGALAHELAHFALRRPGWCSAALLQALAPVVPAAALAGRYLHRQEEMACDEIAVSILGRPEVYAGMLAKCFRFARGHGRGAATWRLHALPDLVGGKPLFSERVERIVGGKPGRKWTSPPILTWAVWGALFALLFFDIWR
jgi:Zn-dependent protease with chaperone function